MSSQNEKIDCLFCRIIRKEIPSYLIYEDADVFAFLDISPVNKGHTLVVSKNHFDSILDMDDKAICSVFKAVRDIAKVVQNSVNAQGFNILVNNKKAAGQLIDHAHMHIIPRFDNDGFEHWHGKRIGDEEMKEIAEKIKRDISSK